MGISQPIWQIKYDCGGAAGRPNCASRFGPIAILFRMYIPPFNRVEDRLRIERFIAEHGFATVISESGGEMVASHLPVLFDPTPPDHGILRSHMARANPQWQQFTSEKEVLCIFPGPHAYISPSWYVSQHTVPTWNYATVHVYGRPTLVNEPSELGQIVQTTTEKYERLVSSQWRLPLSEREFAGMLKAIVGFEIRITRIEAKWKLGQNRSREDQASMLRALQASPDHAGRELAEFITAEGENTP
jgi:transcriptional regulator